MVRSDDDSFYLYGVGEKPEALTLGSLVLEKYWQPLIARHYTHSPLIGQDLEDNAWSSNLKNCIFHGRTRLSPGVGVSGLDIVDLRLAWSKDQERVVMSKSGKRLTLKEPEAFLCDHVLANPKAQSALKLWLSSARSEYVMNMRWARRPKIWLLTGLYVLEGARTVVRKNASTDVDVGVSADLVGALSGVPVGGSVSLGVGDSWELQMEMEEEHVWAAQYRLLDARYLSSSSKNTKEVVLPVTMSLYKDIMSVKSRRRGGGSSAVSDDNKGKGDTGVVIGLKQDVHTAPESETEQENEEEAFEEYEKRLEEAIQMFEAAPPRLLQD